MISIHAATPDDVVVAVDAQAQAEGRKRSQMIVVLLREALAARAAKGKRKG